MQDVLRLMNMLQSTEYNVDGIRNPQSARARIWRKIRESASNVDRRKTLPNCENLSQGTIILLRHQARFHSIQKICVIDRKIQVICALSDFYLRSYNTVLRPTSSLLPAPEPTPGSNKATISTGSISIHRVQTLLIEPSPLSH